MRVECPWCDEDIQEEVRTDTAWEDPAFDMTCPKCGRPIAVSVEVEEYSYDLSKIEEEAGGRPSDQYQADGNRID